MRMDAPVILAHSSRVIRLASVTWRRMRCCRALSGTPASASGRVGVGARPARYSPDSAVVRMRYHQPTLDYVARRTADGRTRREIIRCLKRFLGREIFHRVMTDFRSRQ